MTARHEPPPNYLAVAACVAGTITAGVLLWISVDLFLAICVAAAVVWVAVVMEQRDEANRDTWHARFETAVWKKKAETLETERDRLDADNVRMACRLAELELLAGNTPPALSIVPASREVSDYEWPAIARVLEIGDES